MFICIVLMRIHNIFVFLAMITTIQKVLEDHQGLVGNRYLFSKISVTEFDLSVLMDLVEKVTEHTTEVNVTEHTIRNYIINDLLENEINSKSIKEFVKDITSLLTVNRELLHKFRLVEKVLSTSTESSENLNRARIIVTSNIEVLHTYALSAALLYGELLVALGYR